MTDPTSSQSPDLKREEYGRQTNGEPQHCTGWRDIESAPKDRTPVLVLHRDGRRGVATIDHRDGTEYGLSDYDVISVSYVERLGEPGRIYMTSAELDEFAGWMPLPAPPSSEVPPLGSSEAEGKETRDELEFYVSEVDRLHAFSDDLGLKLEAAEAQLALAVGVLRPFADAFDINSADGDCLDLSDWEAMLNHICIHDFRKASRTLAALSPQEGEGE